MAEKDTTAAAKAAVGRQSRCGPPKSRRWPPKGRPLTAAGCRGSAASVNLFENRFSTLQLSYYLARMRKRSVCWSLFHRQHNVHSCNGDPIHQRNGLGLVWIRSIQGLKCLLVTPINHMLSAHTHAVPDHTHRSV